VETEESNCNKIRSLSGGDGVQQNHSCFTNTKTQTVVEALQNLQTSPYKKNQGRYTRL